MTRDEQLQEYSDDPEYHLPEHHNPLPELDHVGPAKQAIPQDAFRQAQASGQFADLKKAFRGFAFPMTAAFLIWYFAYVLLSVFATRLHVDPGRSATSTSARSWVCCSSSPPSSSRGCTSAT